MGLAQQIEKSIGKAMAPIRAGSGKLASRKLGVSEKMRTLEVKSPAFPERGALPLAFTSDGAGIAPPITWSNVPESARSIVLVAEDPDAPFDVAGQDDVVTDDAREPSALDDDDAARFDDALDLATRKRLLVVVAFAVAIEDPRDRSDPPVDDANTGGRVEQARAAEQVVLHDLAFANAQMREVRRGDVGQRYVVRSLGEALSHGELEEERR